MMLKVRKAYARDEEKGVVRVDHEAMDSLGALVGDVVEITGQRKTVAKCLCAGHHDKQRKVIHADTIVRNNAAVEIGASVGVRKLREIPFADKVVVSSSKPLNQICTKYLPVLLQSYPVAKGDTVVVPTLWDKLTFRILDLDPGVDAVQITADTRFKIS